MEILPALSIVTALLTFISPGLAMIYAGSAVRYAPYPYLFALVNCCLWIFYGYQHDIDTMYRLNIAGTGVHSFYLLMFLRGPAADEDGRRVYLGRFAIAGVGVLAVAFVVNKFVSKDVYDILCSIVAVCVSVAPFWNAPKVWETKTMDSMPAPIVPACTLFSAVLGYLNNTVGVHGHKDLHILIPCCSAFVFALVQVLMHAAFWMWPAAAATGNGNQDPDDVLRFLIDKAEKGATADGDDVLSPLEEGTGGKGRTNVFRQGLAWEEEEDSKDDIWVENLDDDVLSPRTLEEGRTNVFRQGLAWEEDSKDDIWAEKFDDDVKDNKVLGDKTDDTDALHATQEEDKLHLATLLEEKAVLNVAPAVISGDVRMSPIDKTKNSDDLLMSQRTLEEGMGVEDRSSMFRQRQAREEKVDDDVKDDMVLGHTSDTDALHATQEEDKLHLATLLEEKAVLNVAPAVISGDVRMSPIDKTKNSDDLLMSQRTLEEGSMGVEDCSSMFRQGQAREEKVDDDVKDDMVLGHTSDTDTLQAAQEDDKLPLATLVGDKTVVVVNVAPAVISEACTDKLPTSKATLVGNDELIEGGHQMRARQKPESPQPD